MVRPFCLYFKGKRTLACGAGAFKSKGKPLKVRAVVAELELCMELEDQMTDMT